MNFYFYKTINNINGKFYYGSGQFDNYYGSGVAIEKAIKKYGKENFNVKILRYFSTREEAYLFEERFLSLYKVAQNKKSYNLKNSGLGGDTITNNPNKEAIREKISKSSKNRVFSEDHRRKLSEHAKKRKGNKPCKFKGMKYEDYMTIEDSNKIKSKLSNLYKGKSLEEIHGKDKSINIKEKISKSNKGRILGSMNDSHKNNLKISFIERDKNKRKKTIDKNIKLLDNILILGVDENNVNYARRLYYKVRGYEIDMDKYSVLWIKFKEIEFERRSSRNKK